MAQLPMDQAYAKLQSIDGDDYYIRKVSDWPSVAPDSAHE